MRVGSFRRQALHIQPYVMSEPIPVSLALDNGDQIAWWMVALGDVHVVYFGMISYFSSENRFYALNSVLRVGRLLLIILAGHIRVLRRHGLCSEPNGKVRHLRRLLQPVPS